jgi:signal peptidase
MIFMDRKKSVGYNIFRVFKSIFCYAFAVIIIAAAVLFAMDNSPQKSVFGYRYYTVLTPSMQPTYNVGDVVVVKVEDAENINVGDVITFNPSSDSSAYLTHRVTEKIENYEQTGVTCFRTKGDANESDDNFLIDSSRLIGDVTFSIPKLGYIINFIKVRWFIVVPLIILVFIFFRLVRMYFEAGQEDNNVEESSHISENPDVSTCD